MSNDLARLEALRPRFHNATALVFAPGPSLVPLWRGRSSWHPKVAINDAWRDWRTGEVIVADADIVYSSDARWFNARGGLPEFCGVKLSGRGLSGPPQAPDVICLKLSSHGHTGYDPQLGRVCFGMNSGTAATHLAAQLGAKVIALIGFDFHNRNGMHYFGRYPIGYRERRPDLDFRTAASAFVLLAKELRKIRIEIVNCTPGSDLPEKWFPQVPLDAVLERRAA
jgi:hypothetical protein